ncbi:membrane-associated protein, putative, partial [Bodo saltans]
IVALLAPNEGNAANALSIIAAAMQLLSVAYGAFEHFRLRRRIEQLSLLRTITLREPDAIIKNVVTSIDKKLIAEPRSATKLEHVLREEDLAAAPLVKRVALSSEAVLGDLVKLICDAQLP